MQSVRFTGNDIIGATPMILELVAELKAARAEIKSLAAKLGVSCNTADLLTSITVLCLASAAVGAIVMHVRDAVHYGHHRSGK